MLKNLKPSFSILYIVFLAITIIYMLISPEISINAISDTLYLFTNTVLPSLFPFILCTQILIMLNGARIIGFPLRILTMALGYDDNAAGAYAASLVGGYPVGASSLNLLYNQHMLEGNYLAYMLLCSNCGPMYVLATVGTIMLGSYRLGVIIFAAHALGAVIVSLIASTVKVDSDPRASKQPSGDAMHMDRHRDIFGIIECAIMNTAKIMIKIFGMLCFFRLLSDIAFSSVLFTDGISKFEIIARGTIEMVDGCIKASNLPIVSAACTICFIISFGGLSAIFQSISVSKDIPYSKKLFIIGKLIHGVVSSIICYILLRIIPFEVTTASYNRLSYEMYVKYGAPAYTLVIIGICVIYMVIKQCMANRAYK